MVSLLVQTVGRYLILTLLLVAALLLFVSVTQQDWMREELSMKYSSLASMTKKMNMTTSIPPGMASLPPDAAVVIKVHFGLRKTCGYFTASGLGNPQQLLVPTIQLCFGNDMFSNPKKYGIPAEVDFDQFKEENSALKGAFICMVVTLLVVAVAVVVVVVKALKWPVRCLIATLVLCLIAALCVVAAICVIHSQFSFKKDFDRYKAMTKNFGQRGQSGYDGRRKRRDDGSAGYGQMYNSTSYGSYSEESSPSSVSGIQSMVGQYGPMLAMEVMKSIELKESFGRPLTMCGVAIALLLVVAILTVFEYMMIRKSGEGDVKYQNVALT